MTDHCGAAGASFLVLLSLAAFAGALVVIGWAYLGDGGYR